MAQKEFSSQVVKTGINEVRLILFYSLEAIKSIL